MYTDASGTLLDVNEEQYFGFDATTFTCMPNDITDSTDKSVFIGMLGNLYEFTCKFVDSCESTTLNTLQAEVTSGFVQLYMWDRTATYQTEVNEVLTN